MGVHLLNVEIGITRLEPQVILVLIFQRVPSAPQHILLSQPEPVLAIIYLDLTTLGQHAQFRLFRVFVVSDILLGSDVHQENIIVALNHQVAEQVGLPELPNGLDIVFAVGVFLGGCQHSI